MQSDDLDSLFAEAARQRPYVPPALLARVEADALALQPRRVVAPRPRTSGVWHRLVHAFGGGPALAGVCSAAVLGLALGYANPLAVDYLTGEAGGEVIDLFPATDFLTLEG